MKMISLFSGIGGIDLAAQWANIETVLFCENNKFCQKVLNKNFPNVPIINDIKKFKKSDLVKEGLINEEETIDIVSGGFPCQPFSIAGKRKGKEDERFLWDEMFRVIKEFKPTWVVGENVANFFNISLDDVLFQLESEGYETRTFMLPASAFGAIHNRERIFILAYFVGFNGKRDDKKKIQRESSLHGKFPYGGVKEWTERSNAFEPKLRGSSNGIPRGLDRNRNRALGNAVVPSQIYPIFEGISLINKEEDDQ